MIGKLSHCLLSAELVASTEVDESDEFSLNDCIFLSGCDVESFMDVKFSDHLSRYPDILTSIPDRTDLIQHSIKLLTSEPARFKGYPIPFKTHDVMEKEIQ